ncbi:hypothetical protein [Phenylobacterium sp.]|jgi:hypothetical protein|uniref:hypothetical protein n=1 Tax=Phenylobacterium sp. TaxID=1871053 RepID=UPI002F94AABC
MNDFVDLVGASGAPYRFRRLPEGQDHLRIAGNYAWLRPKGEAFSVALLGVTDDLSQARAQTPQAARRGAALYTRLNVARAVREAEHEDLVARYGRAAAEPPPE